MKAPNELTFTRAFVVALMVLAFSLPNFFIVLAATVTQPVISKVPAPLVNSDTKTISSPADFPADEYYRGRVTRILPTLLNEDSNEPAEHVQILIENGKEKNVSVTADNAIPTNSANGFKLKVGDEVVLYKNYGPDGEKYFITDIYRLPALYGIVGLFILLAILAGRKRGFFSVLGLIFSIMVLAKFIVPGIFNGQNPVLITIVGAILIITFSLYLAHGFNKRTSVALAATLITLVVAVLCSILFVDMARLLGNGSEEAVYLQSGQEGSINLRGLFLAGIIISMLGILDDITTAQAAAVDEIRKANPHLGVLELYRRGTSVGREHISSLINTLALAYAGASLPLFILLIVNKFQPLWVILNAEDISDEIVRTVAGSIALILAVPITTILAAHFLGRTSENKKKNRPGGLNY